MSPDDGDPLVLFSTRNQVHMHFVYSVCSYLLSLHDIPSLFFFKNEAHEEYFPTLKINGYPVTNSLDQLNKITTHDGRSEGLNFQWIIEPERKIIRTEQMPNVNVYWAIQETLRKSNRRYNLDFQDSETLDKLDRTILTADIVLYYCQLLNEYARKNDKDLKIVGWESPYVPNAIFLMYCNYAASNERLEYVHITPGVSSFFGVPHGSRLYITNFTRKQIDVPLVITNDDFQFYEQDSNQRGIGYEEMKSQVEDTMESKLNPDRVPEKFMGDGHQQEELIESIATYRERGNHTFALYSHLFFDGVLFDTGPAFEDMCDWIRTTIEIFRGRDDLLLLKPHPTEKNPGQPSMEPEETLREFVSDIHLTDNIRLLEPWEISSSRLYNHIDCGLIWRSNAAIEMLYLDVPLIVSGPIRFREALDMQIVESKEQYENYIDNPSNWTTMTQEEKRQVVKYLYFYENYLHLEFPYVDVDYYEPLENSTSWNEPKLEQLLKEGDRTLEQFLLREIRSDESVELG
ncbi:MAG: hypothetical protein ABEJ65_06040 [bacterium]